MEHSQVEPMIDKERDRFPWAADDPRWNDPEERAQALRDIITLARG